MKLVIADYNYSSWSMRPWMFVRYHKLDIEIERLMFESQELRRQMERSFSNGKVPVLIDGPIEVWDTIAILEYLNEKFPHSGGWPESADGRAVARAVCAEMHSSFQGLRSDIPMNCRRYFPSYEVGERAKKDIDRIQHLWRYCREKFGHQGPWLFGNFTIADAMYAPVVMRFRSVDVDLDEVSQAYCKTMNESEAVREWLQHAQQESHVFDEDELDWPSELL